MNTLKRPTLKSGTTLKKNSKLNHCQDKMANAMKNIFDAKFPG